LALEVQKPALPDGRHFHVLDARGLVRGAIPFRRAESRYEPRADVSFAGG
jgi:hypothetical protein